MDDKYWENFYKANGKDSKISNCSTFATFCMDKYFKNKEMHIVELGCGNGRDSVYFAQNHLDTTAIDQSITAINITKKLFKKSMLHFLNTSKADFVEIDYGKYGKIDVFYSRFTLHAITKNDESILLPKIYKALQPKGLFCVEVRTIKDPLFGVGVSCGDNTYLTDHKRRFIDSNEFLKQVLTLGFKLLYFVEEDNLSIHKNDNPVLMRIILEKE